MAKGGDSIFLSLNGLKTFCQPPAGNRASTNPGRVTELTSSKSAFALNLETFFSISVQQVSHKFNWLDRDLSCPKPTPVGNDLALVCSFDQVFPFMPAVNLKQVLKATLA